jgi:hypothetical protein
MLGLYRMAGVKIVKPPNFMTKSSRMIQIFLPKTGSLSDVRMSTGVKKPMTSHLRITRNETPPWWHANDRKQQINQPQDP